MSSQRVSQDILRQRLRTIPGSPPGQGEEFGVVVEKEEVGRMYNTEY